ncbi:MAG: RND transporter [Legionellales bacterium]|nr:RND transporter [Legionellales bacterium]|tara:strand:- start:6533 stop:8032 length:1500 start_codon:yes stop_codon:yes gene_type:complete
MLKRLRNAGCYAGVTCACLWLAACAVGPDYKPQPAPNSASYTNTPLPTKTRATPDAGNAGNSQRFSAQQSIPMDWWNVLHSQQINTLIKEGMVNSPSLAAAKATLVQAQATLNAEIGNLLFPSLDFTGSAERQRSSTISLGQDMPSSIFRLFNATVGIDYLLDIFGGSRRTIEAYRADVDYEKYQLQAAYLSLSSNIASTSIAVASLSDQIKATKALINDQADILRITKQQFSLGGVSKEDVLLQQTTLAQTEATLPTLKQAQAEATHTLAVLTGKYTNQQPVPHLSLNQLQLPKQLPYKLPAQLVEQRPDIQASQAMLHAANAQIGIAIAQMLPQVTLTGDYGYLSQRTNDFFTKRHNTWTYGVGVNQPLFHGGALWYEKKAIDAQYQIALNQYQDTVLNAFKNVADVLSAIQQDAVVYNREFAANHAAEETLTITRQQYKLGGVDYLSLLDAQEKVQQTRLALIKAQAARYSDTVALYAALGGAWWTPPPNKKETTT